MTKKQRKLLDAKIAAELAKPIAQAGAGVSPYVDAPKIYSYGEVDRLVDAAIERDRIKNFMTFVRGMPKDHHGLIFGTADQARSIARALERQGY